MFAASKSAQAAAAAAATDPLFPYVPLLLETTSTNGQQNNTFLDSSTNNFTITRNGTPTQGSVTPYWPDGYWSNYFDGSSALTTATTAALDLTSGDWTIQGYYFPTSYSASNNVILYIGSAAGNKIVIATIGTAGNLYYLLNGSVTISSSTAAPLNTWSFFALVKSGATTTLYLNGVSIGTTASVPTTSNKSLYLGSDNGSSPYQGYISNLRVLKGTASSTVPTTPLTAITNTSLLTCQSNRFIDNSTNNFTITANGTPKVQAFQPFSPAASYTAAAYGGSVYFNGSTDYLTTQSTTLLASGTGDFTIEFWLYTAAASTTYNIFDFRPNLTNGAFLTFYLNTGTPNLYGNSANIITGGSGLFANIWNHIAISRASNSLKLFVNGTQSGSTVTNSTNWNSGTNRLAIGGGGFDAASLLNGYISNLRYVVGTAVYTGNFTPPTAPVTAITNTSLLTNFTNAGIYDAAAQNNAITVGDAQASTTVSKWSPTSMKFDGTGDWLTAIDNPQLQLGTGDFTIDGWLYLSANGVAYGIVSKGTATTGWSVNVTVLNKLQFSYTTSNLTGATSLATGTWYYFAVVRSGSASGNLKVYLNGSVDATSGGAVTDNFNQTSILYVGADRVGAMPVNGYLQDVRITKYARTITTPTAAFPTR
jgi:hypothetical protein